MIDQAYGIITDPALLIIMASIVGTFATVLALTLPYLKPDPLATRMKAANRRREELRAQQMEQLQRKSKLRMERKSLLRTVVDALQLQKLVATDGLRNRLSQAGWRNPNAFVVMVAARAGAPIVLGGFAALLLYGSDRFEMAPTSRMAYVFAAFAAGYYLPSLLLTNAIQKRQQALTKNFPDALDLLLICVESGLSIEMAFGRVAPELDSAPELAEEFELTTAELAYLPERRLAFENLVKRTGLPAIQAVCTTLIQAEKYGTPLVNALRVAAQENRERRMALAEKKAASLPAKLTVPMILFFMPALFLAILGPVIIALNE